MYYDLIAYFNYQLIYLKFMYVIIEFIIMYYDKIVIPYHDPFEYNYVLILFRLLSILIILNLIQVMVLSFS